MRFGEKVVRLFAAALLLCGSCLLTLSARTSPVGAISTDIDEQGAATPVSAEVLDMDNTGSPDNNDMYLSLIKSGVNNISDRKIISENITVENGDTLYVRDGGELYIMDGVKLTLKGKLKCENGGNVYIKGTVDSKEGSDISVNGKMKLLSTGEVKLGGKLNVHASGTVKGKGAISVLNNFSDILCKGTVTANISAPKPIRKDGVTFVGGIILVNRKNSLPKDYGEGLDMAAYSAYVDMKKASGYDMEIVSGFRSYEKQQEVFDYWCEVDGEERARTYSALPGYSEHQTGLAMDISSLEQSYADTDEGKWLAANCWKYGFIIRYPKDKTDITGYIWEPWHVRYLGKSTAKLVHDSGLTLEEFLCL